MTLIAPTWTADSLYEKLKGIAIESPGCKYTLERCRTLVPTINRILELKAQKNAVILAHTYVHPDILYTVADYVGDSYGLAKQAMATEATTIVFPAVRFMAETAKILSPQKTVLDPNRNGGCSLADSITAQDAHALRKQYPDHTFVCYINTTAAVKAACDVCVTSSNVYKIMAAIPNNNIYFLPDKLMGENVRKYLEAQGIRKNIVLYDGTCYVHEEFDAEHIAFVRENYPNATILVHPECKPSVVEKADVVGSTTVMVDYVKAHAHEKKPFMLVTECGVTARLQVELPEARIVGNCIMCRYMKSNSLEDIARVLSAPKPEEIVELSDEVTKGAQMCLEAMFYYAER